MPRVLAAASPLVAVSSAACLGLCAIAEKAGLAGREGVIALLVAAAALAPLGSGCGVAALLLGRRAAEWRGRSLAWSGVLLGCLVALPTWALGALFVLLVTSDPPH